MRVWIPNMYESRYGLLAVMAAELTEALVGAGHTVNDDSPFRRGEPGVMFFFNFIDDIDKLPPIVLQEGGGIALLQLYVDHPYGIRGDFLDRLCRLSHYRLVMPCVDGWHLLRNRWPSLSHVHSLHAVGRHTLCDEHEAGAGGLASREFDVVVAGSIHGLAELAGLEDQVPEQLRGVVEDVVSLMDEAPWTPFEQALDIAMGSRNFVAGAGAEWAMHSAVWRVASAKLNRARRIRLVEELTGTNAVVFGGESWTEVCSRVGVAYGGQVAYGDLPAALRRGRVCVGWGPTQFAHSVSERGLLAMGAGCATIADDRALARPWRDAGAASLFRAGERGALRAEVDRLLADPDECARLSETGRAFVAGHHLWEHRVDELLKIGLTALA